MKKCFGFLLMFLFLSSSLITAQDTVVVRVFDDNIVQWGGEVNNQPPVYSDNGNQMIYRNFKVADGELPYEMFDKPVRVFLRVSEWSPLKEDSTMVDWVGSRSGNVSISALGDKDNRYVFSQFNTAYGDKFNYETEITPSIALLRYDCTVYFYLSVWLEAPHHITMDLVFVEDDTAPMPFWLHPIQSAAGVSHELHDGRFQNDNVKVPADVQNKAIYLFAKGLFVDEFNEVTTHVFVDETEVYSYEPWIESCEEYQHFNWLAKSPESIAWVNAGRAGFCYGAPQVAEIVKSDMLENKLTTGTHSIRIQPDMTESSVIDTSSGQPAVWVVSSFAFGDQNPNAGTATKIDMPEPEIKFLGHDREVNVALGFVNANGDYIHGTKGIIELSAEQGLQFSFDGINWANPLEIDVHSSSVLVRMKGEPGKYTVVAKDKSGTLEQGQFDITVHENFGRYAKASAKDSCAANEAPKHIIDGKINTKWCSNHQQPPYDIRFALDQPRDLNYFVMYHAGAGGENTSFNTGDFEIRVHNTVTNQWEVFDKVTDNYDTEEGNVTYHYKETPVNCDSVMIYLETPEAGGGTVARIYEFEMYNTDEPFLADVKENMDNQVPSTYKVFNNYPNPFNPSTEIKFFIPNRSKVDVTVYNLLGQKISNLLSGELNAGTHTIKWNATNSKGQNVAGGVYFYTVRFRDYKGRNFTISKKMLYLP